MKLSRRSLFAVPAAVTLASPAAASEAVPVVKTIPRLHGTWCMFEHRVVSNPMECLFVKDRHTFATYVSEDGRCILSRHPQDHVQVPFGNWEHHTIHTVQRSVLDRLEACLDVAIHGMTWTPTRDFLSHVGDADRVCRRPPPSNYGNHPGPELYCLSNGPIGYHLTDSSDLLDPQARHGAIVFADRIRVVTVEGMPLL